MFELEVTGRSGLTTRTRRSSCRRRWRSSRRRCRRCGSCEGKRKVSDDAQRFADQDSVNARLRGTRDSPEFAGAVVGDGGVAERNARSLGAFYAWGLGEKREGTEGVYIAWSSARITRPLIRIDAAINTQEMAALIGDEQVVRVETTLAWRWPACQRGARSAGGVGLSAT